MRYRYFFCVILILSLSADLLAERRRSNVRQGFDRTFFGFQISELMVYQELGGEGYSPHFAWTPRLEFASGIGIRGELGIGFLDSIDGNTFVVSTFMGYLSIFAPLPWLGIEIGAGGQRWEGLGESNPIIGINLAYRLPSPLITIIDRVFIGYSQYYLDNNLTKEYQIGIGLNLY